MYHISLPRTMYEIVSSLVRFVLFAIVMLGICLILCTFSPLRWIHPLLRLMGVRNGDLPMDRMFRFAARASLAAAGVKATRVHSTRPRVGSSWGEHEYGIIVANHCSNLDPMVLTLASPHLPKFIGKRSLFLVPVFGWALLAIGFVPIRRNRSKAIEALNNAVHRIMLRFRRSVALFVEGTRCRDGNLILPFKKGALSHATTNKGTFTSLCWTERMRCGRLHIFSADQVVSSFESCHPCSTTLRVQ